MQSKWGCKVIPPSHPNLGVFITDQEQQRVLPTDNAVFRAANRCFDNIFYGLHGYSADSTELRFNNFSPPLAVSEGQEFQIWYAEDLYDCYDGDNGQTCTNMYGLYV